MLDLSFAGYNSIATTSASDPLRVKWDAVRPTFDQISMPLPVILNFQGVSALNHDINRMVTYESEPTGADKWQSPVETVQLGTGDCEDFAIMKYAALLKSGLEEHCLRLVIGGIASLDAPNGRWPHAWCAAYTNNSWWVLDQKFSHLIKPAEYINWVPVAALHASSMVLYGKEFTIAEELARKGLG